MLLPAALLAAMSALAAGPAIAQGEPPIIDVQLTNFAFTPKVINLNAGTTYTLRLTSVSGGGHSFGAKDFFARAAIAPSDRAFVRNGAVEVPGRQVRVVHFTAPRQRGSYRLKCTHALHKTFGMTGTIVVR